MVGFSNSPARGAPRRTHRKSMGLSEWELAPGLRAEADQDRLDDGRVIERVLDTERGSTHGETTMAGTRTP
jgi:hypothetical protein